MSHRHVRAFAALQTLNCQVFLRTLLFPQPFLAELLLWPSKLCFTLFSPPHHPLYRTVRHHLPTLLFPFRLLHAAINLLLIESLKVFMPFLTLSVTALGLGMHSAGALRGCSL